MTAISKQIWNIENSLDISNMSESEILSTFYRSRTPELWAQIDAQIELMINDGKTQPWERISLVDKGTRRMARVREFVSVAAAEEFLSWLQSNVPSSVPNSPTPVFSRATHEAVDNMTIQQFLENWPNN